MNSLAGPNRGCSRWGRFLSGGTALARACLTVRRWTPSFFATARIAPAPCSHSRRICSNSSTFVLLSNRSSAAGRMPRTD